MVSSIVVLVKETPGGRCQLYLSFAEALQRLTGATAEVLCAPDAPAILINGTVVAPSDGVILSADELHAGIRSMNLTCPDNLLAVLDEVETRFMDELEKGG